MSPAIVPVPRSVLVGSSGRNTGKTEFACALIRALRRNYPVWAVKVTTIYAGQTSCVHGESGCGVCTSMDCDWLFTGETDPSQSKDTSRMLAAGAQKVWWLRVREGSLRQAASELARMVPADGVVVIESNGIRQVCEPDLFFLLGDPSGTGVKKSAKAVLGEVDEIVSFDGTRFSFDPAAVHLHAGRCHYPLNAGAILLAGGQSTRMGTDKRFLKIGDVQLVEHVHGQLAGMFEEIVLSVSRESCPVIPGTRQVADELEDGGPMGALASSLQQSTREINFVTACDIPDLPLGFVAHLLRRARDHQVVVPVDSRGRYEPLFAVYNRSVLPSLHRLLDSGERRVRVLFDHVDTCRITIPPGIDLKNLNTKADYLAHLAG